MQDYEKLGAFYLGKIFDPSTASPTDDLLLYDARDLTTHAVCVGMTGSGKTGLCLTLLEEAAIDGIPAIAIDPKGDLGNLLLTFPNLESADFQRWLDPAEAARQGMQPAEYASQLAATWRSGLAASNQTPERIARLRAAADLAIYTPGSTSGRPLNILHSLDAPAPGMLADSTAHRDRIVSAVSGLLGLVGITADPIQSREHILLSTIVDRAWRQGKNLDLPTLIQEVQKPSFDRIGVFDLETFFPARERLGLAMLLNNLLASPGFSAWMEGEPLNIQNLLYTPDGKPRISILSIAHLSDAERMFFVTILLNELLAWIRTQPGTASLRAILYMDEIYGYFPPTAMPPAKLPMLTLLKQGRAFGLGVVLATQNPVDLDYKGLANTGTWFIGRLQTDRDKQRVIEGLESAGGTGLDRSALDTLLSNLHNRVFLMRNAHDDRPALFQTRHTLSYLRGPLTLPQIQSLCAATPATPPQAHPPSAAAPSGVSSSRPVLPPGIPEQFLRPQRLPAAGASIVYRPAIAATARLHYVDSKTTVDTWTTVDRLAPLSPDGNTALWESAQVIPSLSANAELQPLPGATFAPLPAGAARPKNYKDWEKVFASQLYQDATLDLFSCPALKLNAKPGETEGEFTARANLALREQRDIEIEKLRRQYAPKLAALDERLRRAEDRVSREQSQASGQKFQTAVSVGASILGALFGRKVISVGNMSRAATAMRGAGRISREQDDVARAQESVTVLQQQLTDLQADFDTESSRLQSAASLTPSDIQTLQLHPRKGDVTITALSLAWVPD